MWNCNAQDMAPIQPEEHESTSTTENTPIGDPDCPWDTAIRVMEPDMLTPKIIKRVTPEIPEAYKGQQIEAGTYIFEAYITTEGNVCGLRLIKNPEKQLPELEKAVIDAMLQWKFEPALKNGKPVDCIMTLTAMPELN